MKENGNMKFTYHKKVFAAIICFVLLISGCICFSNRLLNRENKINQDNTIEENDTNNSIINNTEDYETYSSEKIQSIYKQIKEFEFMDQEYPIDTTIYDLDMEQEYKEAFLKLIFNKEMHSNNNFSYSFASIMDMEQYSNEGYIQAMENNAQYWYLDFDGDGLPELVINLPETGKCIQILKYDIKKKCVYVFLDRKNNNTNFLCSNNLYYHSSGAGIVMYEFHRYDLSGNCMVDIDFHIYTDPPQEYYISYINRENIDNIIYFDSYVSKETWDELIKNFLDAIDHVPPSKTYNEVFGDNVFRFNDLSDAFVVDKEDEEDNCTNENIVLENRDYKITSLENKENIEKLSELIKGFDFTIQESPLNMDIYNIELEQKYKEAFLTVIFDKSVNPDVTKSSYTFADNMGMIAYSDKYYLNVIVNQAKYWYLDVDLDGMPELVINYPGALKKLQILKYDPEKNCASLIFNGGLYGWNFMCSGNLYYRNHTSAGISRYGIYRYDAFGNCITAIDFRMNKYPIQKYRVSYQNSENTSRKIDLSAYVNKEIWEELTKKFFDAIDNVPPSSTFEEIFGDMAVQYIDIKE